MNTQSIYGTFSGMLKPIEKKAAIWPIAITFVTTFESCEKETEWISGAIGIFEARINKKIRHL